MSKLDLASPPPPPLLVEGKKVDLAVHTVGALILPPVHLLTIGSMLPPALPTHAFGGIFALTSQKVQNWWKRMVSATSGDIEQYLMLS